MQRGRARVSLLHGERKFVQRGEAQVSIGAERFSSAAVVCVCLCWEKRHIGSWLVNKVKILISSFPRCGLANGLHSTPPKPACSAALLNAVQSPDQERRGRVTRQLTCRRALRRHRQRHLCCCSLRKRGHSRTMCRHMRTHS